MQTNSEVIILAADGASLGPIFQTALTARGWATTLFTGRLPADLRPPSARLPRTPVLVVIEDDDAMMAAPLPGGLALDHAVCVGSITSIATLARLAARGATVFDQAAPILVLLDLVHDALRASQRSRPDPAAVLARSAELTERHREVRRLARLTPAEAATLRAVVSGLTATEIAGRGNYSLHTVRSHIKAILGKLEVRTQVSAVAMVHRCAPYPWLLAGRARFANSGTEDAATRSR